MSDNENPRLAALSAAEGRWGDRRYKLSTEGVCNCECEDPDGDYADAHGALCEVENPEATWCNCTCHDEVWDAHEALTDDDNAVLVAMEQEFQERILSLVAELLASGQHTLGDLLKWKAEA